MLVRMSDIKCTHTHIHAHMHTYTHAHDFFEAV